MGFFSVDKRHAEIQIEVNNINSLLEGLKNLKTHTYDPTSKNNFIFNEDDVKKYVQIVEKIAAHINKADGIYSSLRNYLKDTIFVSDSKGEKVHYTIFRNGVSIHFSIVSKLIEEYNKRNNQIDIGYGF